MKIKIIDPNSSRKNKKWRRIHKKRLTKIITTNLKSLLDKVDSKNKLKSCQDKENVFVLHKSLPFQQSTYYDSLLNVDSK